MRTEVTELPESRARLEVGIEPEVLAQRVDRAAKQMAGEMKLPGFRKGKVPPQLVIQRIGREAVLEQAIRDSLPEWYERAIVESGLPTVGDPKLDVEQLPGDGRGAGLLDRGRRAAEGEAGRLPRARGRQDRGRGAGRRDLGGARAPARGVRQPEPGRAAGGRGRRRRDRLRGHDRRRAVRGLERQGLHDRARLRRPDARVQPGPRGEVGGRRGRDRGDVPATTTSRRTSPARPRPSRSR